MKQIKDLPNWLLFIMVFCLTFYHGPSKKALNKQKVQKE